MTSGCWAMQTTWTATGSLLVAMSKPDYDPAYALLTQRRPRNVSGVEDIFLSERASFRMNGSGTLEVMDEAGTEDIWYKTMSHGRQSAGLLFALHEACIQISYKVIDHHRTGLDGLGKRPSLATLYQLLSARFHRKQLDENVSDHKQNDLFDLCRSSHIYGPRSVLALTKLEWWGGHYDV